MKATLNFPEYKMAKEFASAWAYFSLSGHDMTAVRKDGSVGVTVYDVDETKKQWIDGYIAKINDSML